MLCGPASGLGAALHEHLSCPKRASELPQDQSCSDMQARVLFQVKCSTAHERSSLPAGPPLATLISVKNDLRILINVSFGITSCALFLPELRV